MADDDRSQRSAFWGVAPYVRKSADEVMEVQRRRLFYGLSHAVASKGYAAASVADVLAEVRISRRTFYEFFKDKEDCFLAAYEVINRALIKHVRAHEQKAQGVLAQIMVGHKAHLHFVAADPVLAQAFMVGIRSAGPAALARRAAIHQEFVRKHKAFHRQLRRQFPELPDLPDTVFLALVGGVNKMITDEIEAGRAAQVENRLAEILYFTLSIYGLDAVACQALKGDFSAFGES